MSSFVSPKSHEPLMLSVDGTEFTSASGLRYPVRADIADFIGDAGDDGSRTEDLQFYRNRATEYDRGMDVVFKMLFCDEAAFRRDMIGALQSGAGSRILEIGCGTCRDTAHLLGLRATVFAGDPSREMLDIGQQRLRDAGVDRSQLHMFRGDAMELPFPDGFFDAAFHFGGLNLFPDIALGLKEMARGGQARRPRRCR